jgi:magnesium-dependent phosphatase 1
LFFDDEARNKEVERLGVTFQIISSSGMTNKTFEQGLTVWRQRHAEGEKEQNLE